MSFKLFICCLFGIRELPLRALDSYFLPLPLIFLLLFPQILNLPFRLLILLISFRFLFHFYSTLPGIHPPISLSLYSHHSTPSSLPPSLHCYIISSSIQLYPPNHPLIQPPTYLLSIQTSIHPSSHPFIYLPIHLYIYPSILSFILPPIHQSTHHRSTHLSTHPPIHPSTHLSTHLSTDSSIYSPSLHPSIHPPTHSFIYPFVHPSINPHIHIPFFYSSIAPSIHSLIPLSFPPSLSSTLPPSILPPNHHHIPFQSFFPFLHAMHINFHPLYLTFHNNVLLTSSSFCLRRTTSSSNLFRVAITTFSCCSRARDKDSDFSSSISCWWRLSMVFFAASSSDSV